MKQLTSTERAWDSFLEWIESEKVMDLLKPDGASESMWWGRGEQVWQSMIELTQELHKGVPWFVKNFNNLEALTAAVEQAPGARNMINYLKSLPGFKSAKDTQRLWALENHMYVTMIFTRVLEIAERVSEAHIEVKKEGYYLYLGYPSVVQRDGTNILKASQKEYLVFLDELRVQYEAVSLTNGLMGRVSSRRKRRTAGL